MKIDTAEFVLSANRPNQFQRDGRPEIGFVGRSNVGKSSLMNKLLARKGLARTSSTPGRTQAVNYFLINQRYYFVDLPGYGYAKAPRSERDRWARLMDQYFSEAGDRDLLLIQLVDGKVGATPLDQQASDYFDSLPLMRSIAATKIDKLPRSRRVKQLKSIRHDLDLPEDVALVACSATTGEGMQDLWKAIRAFLDNGSERVQTPGKT